jgi:hypothetical protein
LIVLFSVANTVAEGAPDELHLAFHLPLGTLELSKLLTYNESNMLFCRFPKLLRLLRRDRGKADESRVRRGERRR